MTMPPDDAPAVAGDAEAPPSPDKRTERPHPLTPLIRGWVVLLAIGVGLGRELLGNLTEGRPLPPITFLVVGFAIHNVTEGIGIAAPILKQRPPLWTFAALTALAGGPAVIGMWLGSLAYAPQWSALARRRES